MRFGLRYAAHFSADLSTQAQGNRPRSATIGTMRRLFLIFLLTLLPLQASWAAVCAYCPEQCISESAASPAADDASPDAGVADMDSDCSCCQLGGVGIATAAAAPAIFPPPDRLTLGDAGTFADSGSPDRPERPKWTRAD
jgi:hypothetical protein